MSRLTRRRRRRRAAHHQWGSAFVSKSGELPRPCGIQHGDGACYCFSAHGELAPCVITKVQQRHPAARDPSVQGEGQPLVVFCRLPRDDVELAEKLRGARFGWRLALEGEETDERVTRNVYHFAAATVHYLL